MTVCRSCTGRTGKALADGYCEVCEFAFLVDSSGMPTNVTCLHAEVSEESAAPVPARATRKFGATRPTTVPSCDEPTTTPVSVSGAGGTPAAPNVVTPPARTVTPPAVVSVAPKELSVEAASYIEKVFAVIAAEGPVGKARILEASGTPEMFYLECIRELLLRERVLKEGEKRGTKYRTK